MNQVLKFDIDKYKISAGLPNSCMVLNYKRMFHSMSRICAKIRANNSSTVQYCQNEKYQFLLNAKSNDNDRCILCVIYMPVLGLYFTKDTFKRQNICSGRELYFRCSKIYAQYPKTLVTPRENRAQKGV